VSGAQSDCNRLFARSISTPNLRRPLLRQIMILTRLLQINVLFQRPLAIATVRLGGCAANRGDRSQRDVFHARGVTKVRHRWKIPNLHTRSYPCGLAPLI